MTYLQYTEFRNHSKTYLDKIEGGEEFIIVRKGRPIARLLPFEEKPPGWQRKIKRVHIEGKKSTLNVLREEREQS